MLIERPPSLYRLLIPEARWRMESSGRKVVYLTFDDGPIPKVTPWVLDLLDSYGIKATFFLVGENVQRHPELLEEIRRRGHSYGNHTMHHLQGLRNSLKSYLRDIEEADRLVGSTLFRPPHGLLYRSQSKAVAQRFEIIMHDLVTRDYDKSLAPEKILDNVCRYARNGSIIVFHDSLKAERNLRYALPRAIEWLRNQGYEFEKIPM